MQQPTRGPPVTRVALVRLSALGDVTECLGAVQALRRARPDLELHFVTQQAAAPLLDGLALASVVVHDRRAGWRGVRATAAALRRLDLDQAIDLQGNWKSALVTRLSGARHTLGAARPHRQEPWSALLLQRRVAVDGAFHPAVVAHHLLRSLAPDLDDQRVRLDASAGERAAIATELRALGLDPTRPFEVLVVGDPRDNRSWPVAAMAQQAARAACPALWLCGPDERNVALPEGAVVLAQTAGSVRALVALGVAVREARGRVLGPDRGATHVLAATGAETVVLFGPQDPGCTAPVGARVVVRADGPGCVPCKARRCRHAAGPVCMEFGVGE
ncbi:MAG: glycosyltransferase family 9 protein [Planctomycetes bacterium]|nr:glycosyltransferase family 9 protein [Planctomycetota bacterium]MCB9872145.1 glycosyltransferase family 9 protein [Planctomycetota bacterium]